MGSKKKKAKAEARVGGYKRATIWDEGTRVWAPIGKRADGDWDGRHRIIAIFLEAGEAKGYAASKLTQGLPAYVVKGWKGGSGGSR